MAFSLIFDELFTSSCKYSSCNPPSLSKALMSSSWDSGKCVWMILIDFYAFNEISCEILSFTYFSKIRLSFFFRWIYKFLKAFSKSGIPVLSVRLEPWDIPWCRHRSDHWWSWYELAVRWVPPAASSSRFQTFLPFEWAPRVGFARWWPGSTVYWYTRSLVVREVLHLIGPFDRLPTRSWFLPASYNSVSTVSESLGTSSSWIWHSCIWQSCSETLRRAGCPPPARRLWSGFSGPCKGSWIWPIA